MKQMRHFKTFILSTWVVFSLQNAGARITYRMEVKNFNREATGSSPQQISHVVKHDTTTSFTVSVAAWYDDAERKKGIEQNSFDGTSAYTPEIAQYLDPTLLINCKDPVIANIADTLFGNGCNTFELINKGLKFCSGYLTFSDSLAMEITNGNCKTLPVETILKTKKGTCSEYTNLFLALMRQKGIPARFISGFIYMPDQNFYGCHAWAECYIKGYGWVPVDPQPANPWFPTCAIKLFAGKDFTDSGLHSFMDLVPVSIKIVTNGN